MKSKDDTQYASDGLLHHESPHVDETGTWSPDKDCFPFAPLRAGEVFIKVPPVPHNSKEAARRAEWESKTPDQRKAEIRRDMLAHCRDPDTGKRQTGERWQAYVKSLPVQNEDGRYYVVDPWDGRRLYLRPIA